MTKDEDPVCAAKERWKAQALARAAVMKAVMTAPDRDLPSPPIELESLDYQQVGGSRP